MADDHSSNDVGGIKLFGTTISLELSAKVIKGEAEKKRSLGSHDHDEEDGAAEMKRPEKIIACPRCKSMDTKFCYFNNYNVNQPRHFCKGCQRYWTAGGALRNVPVGAGRRKAKPPGPTDSHYHRNDMATFDFDVQDWHVAMQEGFRQVFPVVKRQRSGSGSQTTTCAYS